MLSGALLFALFVLVVLVYYYADRPTPNDVDPAVLGQLRERYGHKPYAWWHDRNRPGWYEHYMALPHCSVTVCQ